MAARRAGYGVAAVMLAASLVLPGCTRGPAPSPPAPEDPPAEQPRPAAVTMPDVVSSDVDAVGRALVAEGVRVVVVRPESEVPHVSDKDAPPFALPRLVQGFEPSVWTHLIAAQEPQPGAELARGEVATLTAGVHHGAGPFRPWIETHGNAVNERGDDRCGECHASERCRECHTAVGVGTP